MRKIRISKKDRSVKVAEVNSSLSPLPSICKLDGTRRQTAKCKLRDILQQDLEDHTNEGVFSIICNYCRYNCINEYHL